MFGNVFEIVQETLDYPDTGDSYDFSVDEDNKAIVVQSNRFVDTEIVLTFSDDFGGGCEITLSAGLGGYIMDGDEFVRKCYEYLGEERFIVHKGTTEHVVKWDETEMEFPEDLAREICDFIIFGIDEA